MQQSDIFHHRQQTFAFEASGHFPPQLVVILYHSQQSLATTASRLFPSQPANVFLPQATVFLPRIQQSFSNSPPQPAYDFSRSELSYATTASRLSSLQQSDLFLRSQQAYFLEASGRFPLQSTVFVYYSQQSFSTPACMLSLSFFKSSISSEMLKKIRKTQKV